MIISKTRGAFEVKRKAFFLVSQVLSFRYTKRTRQNVADTTFKFHLKLKTPSTKNTLNTLVSRNAGDEKNLHLGGCKKCF